MKFAAFETKAATTWKGADATDAAGDLSDTSTDAMILFQSWLGICFRNTTQHWDVYLYIYFQIYITLHKYIYIYMTHIYIYVYMT